MALTPRRRLATLAADGWELESGEARHAAHPATFAIPPRTQREHLLVGQAVQLLFRIGGAGIDAAGDAGVERMWAIVAGRVGDYYIGILESQPVAGAAVSLDAGSELMFRAEHVIDIADPPAGYLETRYGSRLRPPSGRR